MGALPLMSPFISETYDPEEGLAEGLTKEVGGRRDGRPALRRIHKVRCMTLYRPG
jgi:hypothetical protein